MAQGFCPFCMWYGEDHLETKYRYDAYIGGNVPDKYVPHKYWCSYYKKPIAPRGGQWPKIDCEHYGRKLT